MAFIEDNDLATPKPAPAPRSRLLPGLLVGLVVLNLAAIPLVVLFATGVIVIGGKSDQPQRTGLAALDPQSLVTPTGRRLDVREFGGFVFEVTRIVTSTDMRLNSVTITVPGTPPRQGVFRIGDTFAGGEIRIVDITSAAVVLEHAGAQETFLVDGADPSSVWDRTPSGPQIIPARNNDAIPAMPIGQVRPPETPVVAEVEETEATKPESGIPEGTDIEDLPIEVPPIAIPHSDFLELVATLPDVIDEIVFGQALDLTTMEPIGARILKIPAESIFAVHGIIAGDDIVFLNEHEIRRPLDLSLASKAVAGTEELRIVLWRGDEKYIYTFYRGVDAE